jgi:hypothetical protein
MSSVSVLTFLRLAAVPRLIYCCNYSVYLGTDGRENTVPLLLLNCCSADRAENTVPLLLFAGRCLATAAVQSLISRSRPSNESVCHNTVSQYNNLRDDDGPVWPKHIVNYMKAWAK